MISLNDFCKKYKQSKEKVTGFLISNKYLLESWDISEKWKDIIFQRNSFGHISIKIKDEEKVCKMLDINYINDFRNKFPAPYRTKDWHFVRSLGELIIDDYLFDNNIIHIYEEKIKWIEDELYSDFYIPSWDVYIEYWGMEGNSKYDDRKEKKKITYSENNFNLIELFPEDIKNINDILPKKLLKFEIWRKWNINRNIPLYKEKEMFTEEYKKILNKLEEEKNKSQPSTHILFKVWFINIINCNNEYLNKEFLSKNIDFVLIDNNFKIRWLFDIKSNISVLKLMTNNQLWIKYKVLNTTIDNKFDWVNVPEIKWDYDLGITHIDSLLDDNFWKIFDCLCKEFWWNYFIFSKIKLNELVEKSWDKLNDKYHIDFLLINKKEHRISVCLQINKDNEISDILNCVNIPYYLIDTNNDINIAHIKNIMRKF